MAKLLGIPTDIGVMVRTVGTDETEGDRKIRGIEAMKRRTATATVTVTTMIVIILIDIVIEIEVTVRLSKAKKRMIADIVVVITVIPETTEKADASGAINDAKTALMRMTTIPTTETRTNLLMVDAVLTEVIQTQKRRWIGREEEEARNSILKSLRKQLLTIKR